MTVAVGADYVGDGDQIGDVVTALKRLFGMTDKALALRLELGNAQAIQARRTGKQRFAWSEVVRMSTIFRVPIEVFAMTPEAAVRRAVELGAPWGDGGWAARDSNSEPTDIRPRSYDDAVEQFGQPA